MATAIRIAPVRSKLYNDIYSKLKHASDLPEYFYTPIHIDNDDKNFLWFFLRRKKTTFREYCLKKMDKTTNDDLANALQNCLNNPNNNPTQYLGKFSAEAEKGQLAYRHAASLAAKRTYTFDL